MGENKSVPKSKALEAKVTKVGCFTLSASEYPKAAAVVETNTMLGSNKTWGRKVKSNLILATTSERIIPGIAVRRITVI